MKSFRILLLTLSLTALLQAAQSGETLRFEVTVAPGLIPAPQHGRLFVVLASREQPEPRNTIGRTGVDAAPVLARDVNGFTTGKTGVIDGSAAIFPIERLSALRPGDYFVQALFDSNIDLKSVNAPGNLYSDVQKVHLDPRARGVVRLQLRNAIPAEQLPPEDQNVKY